MTSRLPPELETPLPSCFENYVSLCAGTRFVYHDAGLAHLSDEVAMSDKHLQNWVEHPALATGSWRDLINAIDSEWDAADTLERRGSLLAIFEAAMESVEETIPLEERENFKYIRWWHYRNYLMLEVLIGQELCVETLFAVTEREIAAGRMDPTDRLREIALRGMAQPHLTHAELIETSRPTSFAEKPVEKKWLGVQTLKK